MAQVPYGEGVATVAPETSAPDDYQHINTSPDQFGAAIGTGLEKLGAGSTSAGKVFGNIQTSDSLNGAMTSANAVVDKFRTLKGADALNAQKETSQQVDQIFADARKGLSTPEQQFQFDQEARTFRNRYLAGMINSHADQQATVYGNAVNNASYENGRQIIAGNPNDPDSFEHGVGLMAAGRLKNLQLNGLADNPDIVADSHRQTMRDATEARITALIASPNPADIHRAMDIWDANRPLMQTGKNYDALNAKVTDVFDKQTTASDANKYLRAMENPEHPGSGMFQNIAGETPQDGRGSAAFNLGNVKTAQGAATNTGEFEQPATPTDGVVLAANNLRTGYRGMTIAQIGAKWAPPGDHNNTAQWIQNVSDATGYGKDFVPNLDDPAQLKQMLAGISIAEKSPQERSNFTDSVLNDGVQQSLQGGSAKTAKARILLDEAGTLAQIDKDYADNPKMGLMVRSEVQRQYSVARLAQQAVSLTQSQAINTTVRAVTDMIYKDPTQDIEPFLGQHPELTGEQAEHARELRRKVMGEQITGASGDYGPKYSDIQRRIFGTGPDRIVNQEQLFAMTANGDLNPAGYREASNLLSELNKPGAEGDRQLQGNFYKNLEKSITLEDPDLPGIRSQGGTERWSRALPLITQAVATGRAKGLTNEQLMDPASKDYVGKVLGGPGGGFYPSPAETQRANIADDDKSSGEVAKRKLWSDVASGKMTRADAEKIALARGYIRPEPQVPQGD